MDKEILKIAKNIKENGVKTKLGILDKPKYAYLLALQIANIQKNKIESNLNIKFENKLIGEEFNEDIKYKDYFNMLQRFINFVNSNKRLPNYILTTNSKKKLSINKFINLMSRVIVFYSQNNRYPNYVSIKKSNTNNNSYLKTEGCDGMGQCTSYYCACNCLQQVIYKLYGIFIKESEIAKWAGTTSKGTSHQGINTAISIFNKKYGKNLKIKWYNFSDLGTNNTQRWRKLSNYLNDSKTAIITHIKYRNKWGHYEIPMQIKNDKIIVLNSLGTKKSNGTYKGYIENRSLNNELNYFKGVSQPSIGVVTNG